MDPSHRSALNQYFPTCVNAILECLFRGTDTLSSGTFNMFSNAVTDIIQDCDHENLQQQLRSICEQVYNKLNEHLNNPSLMGHLN